MFPGSCQNPSCGFLGMVPSFGKWTFHMKRKSQASYMDTVAASGRAVKTIVAFQEKCGYFLLSHHLMFFFVKYWRFCWFTGSFVHQSCLLTVLDHGCSCLCTATAALKLAKIMTRELGYRNLMVAATAVMMILVHIVQ